MTNPTTHPSELERRFHQWLKEKISVLPEGNVVVSSEPPSDVHGLIIRLRPVNPKAASVMVHFESPVQLDLTLGVGCHFELHSKDIDGLEAQFREILDSVIEGGFEETVWQRGDRVLKSKGLLRFAQEDKKIVYRNWADAGEGRRTKKHFSYKPF